MKKQQEKILNKVQKLLSLAGNNSNQEESQSAMLKAQELLAKHGLEMKDVQSDIKDKEVLDIEITNYGRTLWWHKILSKIVADNFRCQAYCQTFNRKSCIKFIGLSYDIELAKEIYYFALNSIKYSLELYGARKQLTAGEKNDYIDGYLNGLKSKFEKQVKKENWGLVLVKDSLVEEYINQKKFKKTKLKIKTGNSNEAYSKGYENGKNFDNSKKQIIG